MVSRTLCVVFVLLSVIVGGVFAYRYAGSLIRESVASPPVRGMPFHTLYWGYGDSDRGFNGPQRFVIDNQSEWQMIWKETFCNPCDVPQLNFTSSTLIAVFYGFAPSTGYATNVTEVRQVGSALRVTILSTELDSGHCSGMEVITHPFHIISISKTQLPVSFEETVSHIC